MLTGEVKSLSVKNSCAVNSSVKPNNSNPLVSNSVDSIPEEIYQCKFSSGNEQIVTTGVIRREVDPRDLGNEFLYIFYFDKPYVSWLNGSGLPQFVDSMEIVTNTNKDLDLSSYLEQPVQIAGELTWGYAESRIIDVMAIR